MDTLATFPQESKGPVSPVTPDQRVRKIREAIAMEIAELLYQADKGNRHCKLSDLTGTSLANLWLAHAHHAVFGTMRTARITRVNVERAHAQALKEDETETLAKQAREDIQKYGGRA